MTLAALGLPVHRRSTAATSPTCSTRPGSRRWCCSSSCVVLYNVRTRALHRHQPYVDLWEWLWWTGLITFSLLIIEALFVFDFILVLLTAIIGLGALVWIRFVRFPPILRAHEQRLARERYFTQAEVRRSGGDDPAPRRPAQRRQRRSRGAEARGRCRSRSAGSGSATGDPTGRRARPA